PVDQHQRQDRARLDRDVEQLRARAEPALRDEQMPGARDGQKLGDAFDDAEEDGVEGVGHLAAGSPKGRRYGGAILTRAVAGAVALPAILRHRALTAGGADPAAQSR